MKEELHPLEGLAFPSPARAQPPTYIPPLRIGALLPHGSPLLDHVFEAMMYVDNSIDYSKPESVIDNLQVIKDIVKKSGMKPRVVAPPDLREADKLKDRDAVRQ
uniref:Uncharacterized protein n=1 Tax=Timema tahoe TaxID=61484 RepID=A0A7R9NUA2_9NEOP|nr:unnamed protein product [Timema tahoe]